MGSYLYALIIYPLEMFIETVFSISMDMIDSAGYAIVFVSLAVQLLVLPMYRRADELQDEERQRQKEMAPVVKHIKKTFRGDEKVMMLSAYYRCENYHMYYQLRAILPLLLQIPFFMAAYDFLSACPALDGSYFYFLKDMGKPDEMIKIGGFAVNVMPIAMTLINIISGMIYTRGLELKDKLQLYITAGVFLVLLYDSPSGLVFYWTLNNVFSLLKNIFLKLVKNPRPIVSAGSLLFVAAYCFKCWQRGAWDNDSGRIVMIAVFLIGCIPAIGLLLDKHSGKSDVKVSPDEKMIFKTAGIVATITMGVLIPVVTIASSPTEFVVRGHYVTPLVQVLYSLLVAAGLFILWGNLIFNFYSSRARKILCFAMPALSVCALVNSQFFRAGLKNMSMYMQYFDGFGYDLRDKLVNLAVLAGVVIACFLLYRLNKKSVLFVCASLVLVTTALSAYNTFKVIRTIDSADHVKDDDYYINSDAAYHLDKKGKNVVVLFEDRAFGQFLPYIMNEKPELARVYSGFTYYPNTISTGTNTYTGSPALFGGYDYTTYNVRNEDEEYLTNAVKVMPKLFAQNGFKTTMFDKPIFADLGDRSLEEFYHEVDPSINAYYADGVVKSKDEADRDYLYFEKAARSNYIRHSVFLSSPLFLRKLLYDEGRYLTQTLAEDRITFAGHVEELNKLPDLADVSTDGSNTFTLVENDTPHSMNVNLQMPDYTMEDHVDNSAYLTEWKDRLSEVSDAQGREINLNSDMQIQAYEVNMATILSIGDWLRYLKENDLYDNTRIIIVADHGYSFFAFDDMIMNVGDDQVTDLDLFTPLLMVKDFAPAYGGTSDSSKPLETSDEFMTNADVPAIAFSDLIADPVNPYTGNPVNSLQKLEREQYVFDDRIWLSVHDNIYDLNNWSVIGEEIK